MSAADASWVRSERSSRPRAWSAWSAQVAWARRGSALRAGTDLARSFADGAWLVELGEVSEAALVTDAVLGALDLRDQAAAKPMEILVAHLRERRLLLLLDNCEHLLEAAAQLVNEILRAAPDVRVITTTREPLQVPGEYVVPVPPLELPSMDGAEPLAQLRQNEAVMLFTERAAAASGAFELSTSNQAAVVAVCRRLDGVPLAIELAAVRTRVLSVEQILHRLSDRFALAHRRGPRCAPAASNAPHGHRLELRPVDGRLSRSCCGASAFSPRDFTLEDVEGVCESDALTGSDALDLLASLVDKSLVTTEDVRGTVCYRLHETMREYARLKLHEADEEDLLRDRCVEHYRLTCLRSADEARYHLVEWLAWADVEIDNLRAVLHQCVGRGDLARGLDIASSMRYYWITHGTTEAVRWLDQTVACWRCDGAHDGAGLLPPWLVEHAAGRSRRRQAMDRTSGRHRSRGRRAGAAVRIAVDRRLHRDRGRRS